MSNARVGVFVCDCGDHIRSILDMDTLETKARELSGVTTARRLRYSCSPDGLAAIQSTVAEADLDRVLVAGCSPRAMASHLQSVCKEAGISKDMLELVDIREGCAWVHQNAPQEATAKALDMIRMGAASIALRQAHKPVSAEIVPAALVIGGGVAGITSALTLANAGVPVKLIERDAALGGMLRDGHTLSSGGFSAAEALAEKIDAVTHHPRIEVLLGKQATDVSGTVGRYTVTVNGSSHPSPASKFDVGAIVIATGARALQPHGLFRYDGKRVVTQIEFERELREKARGSLTASLPTNVTMILCAGQRNEMAHYCSAVCCTGALKQAIEVKAISPETDVTILFRDLYLPDEGIRGGKILEAREVGVQFIRYTPSSPPTITGERVEVYDALTQTTRHLPYDRIVLATPLVPQDDASVVAHTVGISQDKDGFFPEARYRLRPENIVDPGIYVCGAAHHPASWVEAELQAASAAFRALRHLRSGQVTHRAPVAIVNEDLCTGCGHCVDTCAFGAISLHRRDSVLDLSQIDPLRCKGCGNCAVACPSKAINLPNQSDAQILAQIDAAMENVAQNSRPSVLAFGCEWSGHAAAELAGANRLDYPVQVRLIRVGCSARLDPIHILWAFFRGADGVFLGACPPGDCHYVNGNLYAQRRINTLGEMLTESGFDPRRLCLEWITPDDPYDFVGKITRFTDLVRALGPSPARKK